jgi:hypothetical protein
MTVRTLPVAAFFLGALVTNFLVTPHSDKNEGETPPEKALKKTADKINKETGVAKQTLEKDIQAILEVFPTLREQHEGLELKEEKTVALLSLCWERLRGVKSSVPTKMKIETLKNDEVLTGKQLLAYAGGYGYLVVTSKPPGAKVTFREIDWGETKTDGWEEAGTHTIRLEKAGFEPVEDNVTITKGRTREYDKELKKK